MKLIRKMIVVLLMMSIMPLCAMENQKNNVISDADLLARKKAFALELKDRKSVELEFLFYPKNAIIEIDLKALNKELELTDGCEIISTSHNRFIVPAGMDERFIHKTLIPEARFIDQVDLSH